jgi:hypothetical protein
VALHRPRVKPYAYTGGTIDLPAGTLTPHPQEGAPPPDVVIGPAITAPADVFSSWRQFADAMNVHLPTGLARAERAVRIMDGIG